MGEKQVKINIFDPEENTIYPLLLSEEDAKRCSTDMEFCQLLLQYAKNDGERGQVSEPEQHESEGDHLKRKENVQMETLAEKHNENACYVNVEEVQAWSHNETLALIAAYDHHKENFQVARKRKFVWQDIANEMLSNGFERSAAKCEVKWRNLLRTYKNVKDIQTSSGRGVGKFKFFNQIDEILGDKPSTSSSHTFSTTKCDILADSKEDDNEKVVKEECAEIQNETNPNNDNPKNITPKRKRVGKLDEKLKKKSEDLMEMKINYLKKKNEEENNKQLARQRKIELKEKMLEIEAKKVALLEKYLEKENEN